MKKVLAIMLSAAMTVGFAVPAMAETAEQVPVVEAETGDQVSTEAETSDQASTAAESGDQKSTEINEQNAAEAKPAEQSSDNTESSIDTGAQKTETVSEPATAYSEASTSENAVSFGTDTYKADTLEAYGTGIYKVNGKYVYYLKGKRQYTTSVTKVNGVWYNLVNGVVTAKTVAKNSSGWWYINASGQVDFKFTGIASNKSGTWYCVKGKVDFNKTGTILVGSTPYYVRKGKVETSMNRSSAWRSAYCQYLRKSLLSSSVYSAPYSAGRCTLAFVDNDNIPELIIQSNKYDIGGLALTYHSGKGVQCYNIGYNKFAPSYIYRGNKLYCEDYYCPDEYHTVIQYSGGWKPLIIGDYDSNGVYSIKQGSSNWTTVSKATFYSKINAVYNSKNATYTNCWLSPSKMISSLGY